MSENKTEKACAPLCTIACVHQASTFDQWRHDQHAGHYPGGKLVQLRTHAKAE